MNIVSARELPPVPLLDGPVRCIEVTTAEGETWVINPDSDNVYLLKYLDEGGTIVLYNGE